MMPRPPNLKKSNRSQADLQRIRNLRSEFQRARPTLESLVSSGDYTQPVLQSELVAMLELAAALKGARQARKLSLADVSRRSGIDKAALSRIENGQNINPTISTLETIARSLGSRLRVILENAADSAPST